MIADVEAFHGFDAERLARHCQNARVRLLDAGRFRDHDSLEVRREPFCIEHTADALAVVADDAECVPD